MLPREAAIEEKLDEVAGRRCRWTQVDQVVGVAGSITTITAHALGLASYQSEAIHAAVVPLEKMDAAAS